MAVLTKGAAGVSAWTGEAAITVPARRVEVVDAVGAGDAFMAGLLTALQTRNLLTEASLRGLGSAGLTEAVEAAQSVAAVACTKRGAVMPQSTEIGAPFARFC